MEAKQTALHIALRNRIKTLDVRSAELKRIMLAAGPAHRISRLAQSEDLDRRHQHLAAELRRLAGQGPGILQDARAALSLLADDYEGLLDSLMASTEAHYRASQNRLKHVES